MLDLPDQPVLDKHALVPGCVRLQIAFDAQKLRDEVAALPESLWGTTGGRVGVHQAAEAIFLRGFAPAQGDLPIEDRPPLEPLPYARHLISDLIGARPMRCLLARMPPETVITPISIARPISPRRCGFTSLSNPTTTHGCSVRG